MGQTTTQRGERLSSEFCSGGSVCWKVATIHCQRETGNGFGGISRRITDNLASSQLCTRLRKGNKMSGDHLGRVKGAKWLLLKRQFSWNAAKANGKQEWGPSWWSHQSVLVIASTVLVS